MPNKLSRPAATPNTNIAPIPFITFSQLISLPKAFAAFANTKSAAANINNATAALITSPILILPNLLAWSAPPPPISLPGVAAVDGVLFALNLLSGKPAFVNGPAIEVPASNPDCAAFNPIIFAIALPINPIKSATLPIRKSNGFAKYPNAFCNPGILSPIIAI